MRGTYLLFACIVFAGCGAADDAAPGLEGSGGHSTTTQGGAAGASGSLAQGGSSGSAGNAGNSSGSAGSSAGSAGAGGSSGAGGTGGSAGSESDASAASIDAHTSDAPSANGDSSATSDASSPLDAGHDAAPLDAGLAKGKQTARPIGTLNAKTGFWEYLPRGYGDGTKRPLLVFWHGVGEDGNGTIGDLNKVLSWGPPSLINANQWPADRPFVVLSPQHPAGVTDGPNVTEINDFFTFAMATYDVDPSRIYLTALSSGARGSWDYLGKYKGQQVVAAALIAGDSSTAYKAAGCSLLSDVALWAFHGTADTGVPIAGDNSGMASFLACPMPHKEVIYTTYPGVEHIPSWVMTYDLSAGHDIYAWLLSKSR